MNFSEPNNKSYLPFLAVIFALTLMGAANPDQGLRDVINPNTLDDTRSFDKQIIDMFGGQTCGDGLVQQGEDCDPPGFTEQAQNQGSCSQTEINIKKCSENCKWKTTCEPLSVCGNGIVEANEGESCDDGPLNGSYGYCADSDSDSVKSTHPKNSQYSNLIPNQIEDPKACKTPHPQYCGNGLVDVDENGNALEACDTVNNVCSYSNANVKKPEVHFLVNGSITNSSCLDGTFNRLATGKPLGCDPAKTSRAQIIGNALNSIGGAFDTTFQSYPVTDPAGGLSACDTGIKQSFQGINISNSVVSPVTNAFDNLLSNFDQVFSNEKSQKIVVLITSGLPSNGSRSCTGNNIDQTVDRIKELSKRGVTTQVISVHNNDFTTKATNYEQIKSALNSYAEAGLTDNPNSNNNFYAVDSKQDLKNAIFDITSCNNYSASRWSSCTLDCQSRGNYCGDGVKQAQEECDDGNDNNEDKCKNDCTINEEEVDTEAPSKCGNGLVEEDEACDQGDRNGQRCTPNYGNSCTYCSADCQNILTIDTSDFCGNGQIDQFGTDAKGKPLFESCELSSNREVLAPVGYWAGENVGWVTTQIALVLDTSGSIDYSDLRDNVNALVQRQRNAELAVVPYESGSRTKIAQNFSTDLGKTQNTVDNLTSSGGGEQVYQALNLADNDLDWKEGTKKVIILVNDEEVTGSKDVDGDGDRCDDIKNKATDLIDRDVIFYTVTDNTSNQTCSDIFENDIPNDSGGERYNINNSWQSRLKDISRQIGDDRTRRVSCSDKGSYQCKNQCKNLQNECVDCNTYQGNDSKPKIALLNPMIAGQEKQQWVTSGNQVNRRWGARKDGGSLSNFDRNSPDYDLSKLFLLRPSAPVGINYPGGYLNEKKHLRGSDSSNITPFKSNNNFRPSYNVNGSQREMVALGNKRYLINRNKSKFRDISKYTQIFFSNSKLLQSDQMCSSEYKIAFNANAINSSISQNEDDFFKDIIDSYKDQSGSQRDQTPRGDLFNYPVDGEAGEIKNSYITSPAVPPGAMRIVVKWTGEEAKKWSRNSGEFEGNLYNQVLYNGNKINRSWFRNFRGSGLSTQVTIREINNEKYWWPPSYNIYSPRGAEIAVHDKTSPPDNSKVIQSMTINNLEDAEHTDGTKLQVGEQVAFYVNALGRPIQSFQDSNLEVNIYTYHQNQDPLHSIYKPTYKFKISSSTHSGNPLAPYWHAFNIMKVNCQNTDTWAITDLKGRIITPGHSSHGRVTSRFGDIKKTTKSKTQNPDCSKISSLDYIGNSQVAATSFSTEGNSYWNTFGNTGFNLLLDSNLGTGFSTIPWHLNKIL